mgnify:CR=1 FL=1
MPDHCDSVDLGGLSGTPFAKAGGMRIGVLALLLAACAKPTVVSLGSAELPFPGRVDFLPTALNFPRTQAVHVVNRSRVARSLTVAVAPPFAAPATLEVPGGAEVSFDVVFTPSTLGPVSGTLFLDDVEVPVTGEGVEAPACGPSSACELVHFDPDSLSCVHTLKEEGSSCADELLCIEAGTCRSGACVGQAARCDDRDACTTDACAISRGCQHTTTECAPPANPCLAPTCDPLLGCGSAPVQDGTPCGAVSCALANICLAGACRAVVPPEGFTCSPESACRDEGVCRQQACVVPPATDLSPRWSYVSSDSDFRFEGTTDAQGNWYWVECGGATKPTNPTYRCTAVSFTPEGFERFRTDTIINGFPRGGSRRTQLLASGLFIFVADEATLVAINATSGAVTWHGPLLSSGSRITQISQLAEDGRGTLWVAGQSNLGIRPMAVLSRVQVSTGVVQAETLVEGELGRFVLDAQGAALVQRNWLAGPVLASALERYEPDGSLTFSQRLTSSTDQAPAMLLGDRVVLIDDSVRSARDGTLLESPSTGPWSFDAWPGVAGTSTGRFRVKRSILDAEPNTISLARVDLGVRSELLSVNASEATDLQLTANGDALFITVLGLWNSGAETRVHQVHRLGQEVMSCRLIDDDVVNPGWPLPVQYGGGTGFNGRWLAVRTTADCPSCDFWGPPRVVFFDLGRTSSPGLASSGWVGPRGTPAGSHRGR